MKSPGSSESSSDNDDFCINDYYCSEWTRLGLPRAPLHVLQNYKGACQVMKHASDDGSTQELDPVYTVVLEDAGLQSRINAGKKFRHAACGHCLVTKQCLFPALIHYPF
jgi:hypothetical protein